MICCELIVSVRQIQKGTDLTGDLFSPVFAGPFATKFQKLKFSVKIQPELLFGAKIFNDIDFILHVIDRK
ncbi:hypothetical protein BJF92_21620 [Rhizobium rhizosphaerae]|uniref:Uncharacterized protein n=1 Tax=Xaviernesmea rhizosphaerae TaxID=1672749 RepID=A0A1Q9AP72_9HYPH|nr:hypothetical protein BJF92_21620 [Xaviernesmea rhizosphaerae]